MRMAASIAAIASLWVLPASAAETLPDPVTLRIHAFAEGSRFHVCPGYEPPQPDCSYQEPFAIDFATELSFSPDDFATGSADFEWGNPYAAGFVSGTIRFLGLDRFEGIDFWYSRADLSLQLGNGGAYEYAAAPTFSVIPTYPGAVPEPAAWALILLGFGLVAAVMRPPRRSGEDTVSDVTSFHRSARAEPSAA